MFRTRLSLSTVMLLVVLLAIDLVAFRAALGLIAVPSGQGVRGAYCLLGLLPTLTISFLGLYFLAKSLWACGRTRPFDVGFVVTMFVAALAYVVVCSLGFQPGVVMAYLQPLAPPISDANAATWVPIILMGYSLVVAVPQFLVAVSGGWLFRFCGVGLCRELSSDSGQAFQ